MTRFAVASLAAAAALILSGCGIRGDLERPPPLWGEGARTLAAEQPPEADAAQDPA